LKPLVSIILPVWDVCDLTEQFCDAVLGHTLKPSNELIIIDNGSTDRTPYYLKARQKDYPDRLTIVTNEKNEGYPRGLNQGLLIAQSDYLVCVSNDIYFYRSDWLETLMAPLQQNKKRLVGPRYIDWNPLTEINGQMIPYLEGWMLAFHRRFLKDVGYFDEGFSPAWYEDVDLSWRAMRHGYELVQVDTLPVKHLYGKTALGGPHFHDVGGIGVPAVSERNQEFFRDKIRRNDHKPFYPGEIRCHLP